MTNMMRPSPDAMLGLVLRPAFSISLTLDRPILAGGGEGGPSRAVISINGGTVEGPRLSGNVRPGGSEWARLGPGPRISFDARYVIQADDGTLILVENIGYRWSSPEVEARLRSGAAVPAGDYYMIATPRFEVAAGPHDWLARSILVGRGERLEGGNRISYYTVENA